MDGAARGMAFNDQCFAPGPLSSAGCSVNVNLLELGPPTGVAVSERCYGYGPMTATAFQPSPVAVAREESPNACERARRGRLPSPPFRPPAVRPLPQLPGGDGAFATVGRPAPSQPQPQPTPPGVIPGDQDPWASDSDEVLDALCWMRRHPHDLQVQTAALRALWVLSWEADNARVIAAAGGLPTILETLRRHLRTHLGINHRYNRDGNTSAPSFARQVRLQGNGLAAIQNLTACGADAGTLLEYNAPPCREGVSLILLATGTFAHDPVVASSGCGALANILSNERRCGGVVLGCGGLDILARCVDAHRTDGCVVRSVHECLLVLGAGDAPPRTASYETSMRKGDSTDMDECSTEGEMGHFRGKVNGWGT